MPTRAAESENAELIRRGETSTPLTALVAALRDMSNRTKPNSYNNYAFEKPESELAMGAQDGHVSILGQVPSATVTFNWSYRLLAPYYISVGHQDHL